MERGGFPPSGTNYSTIITCEFAFYPHRLPLFNSLWCKEIGENGVKPACFLHGEVHKLGD